MKRRHWLQLSLLSLVAAAQQIDKTSASDPRLAPPSQEFRLAQFTAGDFASWRWANGFMVNHTHRSTPRNAPIAIFDRNGALVRHVVVWQQGADSDWISFVNISPRGDVLVAGSAGYRGKERRPGFPTRHNEGFITRHILVVDPEGRSRKIELGKFVPIKVCSTGEDIWVAGDATTGGSMVHRYGYDGSPKGTYSLTSEMLFLDTVFLACAKDSLTVYLPSLGEIHQFNEEGVRKWKTAPLSRTKVSVTGFVINDSDELFASLQGNDAALSTLIDRPFSEREGYWLLIKLIKQADEVDLVPLKETVHRIGTSGFRSLLGIDGDQFVYSRWEGSEIFVDWGALR